MSWSPTSFRLSPDELELLNAQAAWLFERHGLNFDRTAVIRNMMRLAKPPDANTPAARRFREAYTTIFGKQD